MLPPALCAPLLLPQHGWKAEAGWVLVGTGVLPLANIVAQLRLARLPPAAAAAAAGQASDPDGSGGDADGGQETDSSTALGGSIVGSASEGSSSGGSGSGEVRPALLYREACHMLESGPGGWRGSLPPPGVVPDTIDAAEKPVAAAGAAAAGGVGGGGGSGTPGGQQAAVTATKETIVEVQHAEEFNTLMEDLTMKDLQEVRWRRGGERKGPDDEGPAGGALEDGRGGEET